MLIESKSYQAKDFGYNSYMEEILGDVQSFPNQINFIR